MKRPVFTFIYGLLVSCFAIIGMANTTQPEVMETEASYVDFVGIHKGPVTVFLDYEFDGNVAVHDSTGLVIKTLKNDLEEENIIMFQLLGKNDSMFRVKAYWSMDGKVITAGLIYKNNNLGIFSNAYNHDFLLYKTPFNRDSIAVRHEYNPEMLEVLDMESKWLKVRTNIDSKIFMGWLPPEMQCSNVYSTCN